MDKMELSDIELEQRLRAHYNHMYGETRQPTDLWQAISSQLGEQENAASAEFARSPNGPYSKADRATTVARDLPQSASSKVQPLSILRRGYWNPAIAATL